MTKTLTEPGVRAKYGWASTLVAIVFGLLYADVLWNAVGDLVQLPKALGSASPWWLLIFDVALPVVVYAIAFLLGRRRRILSRAVFFLIGLAVLSCATVASIVFVQTH